MRAFLTITFYFVIINFFAQGFSEHASEFGLNFKYGSGEYGGGANFVDFNLDGLDDLTYTQGINKPIRFFQNTGEGFVELANLSGILEETKQSLWVDMDNDGDLDLYVTSKNTNKLFENTGDLNLIDITASCGFNDPNELTFCATWFDYDKDALPDLCVSHRTGFLTGDITLYHNLGNGQFENVTVQAGMSGVGNSVLTMTSLDYNNDGWQDLYIGQDYDAGNLLFHNNGNGTFNNVSAASNSDVLNDSMTTTVGDYDNDGDFDLYVTSTNYGNLLLSNQGNGTFVDVTESMNVDNLFFGWSAVFLDADANMTLDLHVNKSGISPPSSYTFYNPGNGQAFLEVGAAWGFSIDGYHDNGSAIGDYNGDGRPDIAKNCSYSFYSNTLWRNDFQDNNYISIDLNAQISNRFAIGAVIEVITGETHQYRRIACGEGFASQNSYTQFFGLGDHENIDEIVVHWPNGIVTHSYNLAANQRITLFELAEGCSDSEACNFDPYATQDDGSCIYPEFYYDCDGNCIQDADGDGICDQQELPGCTDSSACNFNEEATDDDSSCIYSEEFYQCDGSCINDSDSDGVCNELEIEGCQDVEACNFNPNATDPGLCDYVDVFTITGSNLIYSYNEPYGFSYPGTPGSTYEWSTVLNTTISGQGTNEVSVYWLEEGVEILSVIETTETGCVGDTVTVELFVLFASIAESEQVPFVLFPNPATREINLVFESIAGISEFQLYNPIGQEVQRGRILQNSQRIDLSGLSSGIYQITVTGTEGRFSKTLEIR